MKKQKFKPQTLCLYLLLGFLLFISIFCKKEVIEINPKKAILGKWELRKQGTSLDHLIDFTPTGYDEYLNDSVHQFYDYNKKTFTNGDYSINDSTLVYYFYALNGNKVDTISVRYFYTFKNNKTLVLDIDALAILDFFVLEKIQ